MKTALAKDLKSSDKPTRNKARRRVRAAAKTARACLLQERTKALHTEHANALELVLKRNPTSKTAWKLLDGLFRPKCAEPEAPIRDPDTDVLVSDPAKRRQILLNYLASTTVANGSNRSTDTTYWQAVFPLANAPPLDTTKRELISTAMKAISWTEVNNALHKAHLHKHPGPSGIPMEVFKLAATGKEAVEPKCPIGAFVLAWVNTRWNCKLRLNSDGTLADTEAARAELAPLFKKGDPSDPAAYRPLAMIESINKILSLVILSRLERIADILQVLPREQAGFRYREECAAQLAALSEIVTRRKEAGLDTAHAYIDLKAAYDSVPHQALFAKMRWLGFPEEIVSAIEFTYKHSETVISLDGAVVGKAKVTCGLRQGCPMSPLLFNIYICDILHGRHDMKRMTAKQIRDTLPPSVRYTGLDGVVVPGLIAPTDSEDTELAALIRGLKYADDVALFANTKAELQRAVDCLAATFAVHRLSLNPKKCEWLFTAATRGRTPVNTIHFRAADLKALVNDNPVQNLVLPRKTKYANFALLPEKDEVALPIVSRGDGQETCGTKRSEHFRYLGVHIDNDGLFSRHVENIMSNVRGAATRFGHRLRAAYAPPFVRRLFLQCIVYPMFMHGIEVWGPYAKATGKHSIEAINKELGYAARRLMDAPLTSSTHAATREWNVIPVEGIIAQFTYRAMRKWPTLKTWIAPLMRYPALRPHGPDASDRLVDAASAGTWTKTMMVHSLGYAQAYEDATRNRALDTDAMATTTGAVTDTSVFWAKPVTDTVSASERVAQELAALTLAAYGATVEHYCGTNPLTYTGPHDVDTRVALDATMARLFGHTSVAQVELLRRNPHEPPTLVVKSHVNTPLDTALMPLTATDAQIAMAGAKYETCPPLPPDRTRRFHAQMHYSTESTRASACTYRLRPDVPRLTRRLPHLARALVALMTVRASACEGMEIAVGNPCTLCKLNPKGDAEKARELPLANHTLTKCTALDDVRETHLHRVLSLTTSTVVVTPDNATPAKVQDDPDKMVIAHWPNTLSLLLGGEPLVVNRHDEQLGRIATAADVEGWLRIHIECTGRRGEGKVAARQHEHENKPWIPDTVTRTLEHFKCFLFRQTALFLEETMKRQSTVRRREAPLARIWAGWRYTHACEQKSTGGTPPPATNSGETHAVSR